MGEPDSDGSMVMKCLAALALCALPAFAQCSYSLQGKPRGSVSVYKNGIFQTNAQYTQTGPALQTITPTTWADQDQMSFVYLYAIQSPPVPGTVPPFRFNIYIPTTEYFKCSGWQPALTFSLDSAQAPSATNTAVLHLTFTNTVIRAAALQFTVTYNPAVVSSFVAGPGPVAMNAGKQVSCTNGVGMSICIISGANCNTIQDGEVADINVVVNPAGLPTTMTISAASGTLIGTNQPGSVTIPGVVSPGSTGVITAGP